MLRVIDRHAVHALLEAGQKQTEVAKQLGISERLVRRMPKEPPVADGDDAVERRRRGIGRPAVPDAVKRRLVTLMAEDPEVPPRSTCGSCGERA